MSSAINYFIRRFFQTSARRPAVLGASTSSGGKEGGYKIWRKMAVLIGLPAVSLCTLGCFMAQKTEPKERPPFVKYEYLRVRTKRFPWGDGNHSLFHNPHTNALPDGYEEAQAH